MSREAENSFEVDYQPRRSSDEPLSLKAVAKGIIASNRLKKVGNRGAEGSGESTVSAIGGDLFASPEQQGIERDEPLTFKGVAKGVLASTRLSRLSIEKVQTPDERPLSSQKEKEPRVSSEKELGALELNKREHADLLTRSAAMGMVGVILSPRSQKAAVDHHLANRLGSEKDDVKPATPRGALPISKPSTPNASGSRSSSKSGSRDRDRISESKKERPLSGAKRLRPMSQGDGEADLSGFPIIRMDHISLVDSPTLERALADIPGLLKDLYAGASEKGMATPKLAYYLQKQVESMEAELLKRAAEQRVFSILQGTQEVFADYSSILERPKGKELEEGRNETQSLPLSRHQSEEIRSVTAENVPDSIARLPDRSESAGANAGGGGGGAARAAQVPSLPLSPLPPLEAPPHLTHNHHYHTRGGSAGQLDPLGSGTGTAAAAAAAGSHAYSDGSSGLMDAPLSTRSLGEASSARARAGAGFGAGGAEEAAVGMPTGIPPQERLTRREKNAIMKRSANASGGSRNTATAKVDTNNQWGGGGMRIEKPWRACTRHSETRLWWLLLSARAERPLGREMWRPLSRCEREREGSGERLP